MQEDEEDGDFSPMKFWALSLVSCKCALFSFQDFRGVPWDILEEEEEERSFT